MGCVCCAACVSYPQFDNVVAENVQKVNVNDLIFDVRTGGLEKNKGGDAVILLHGFPETSCMYSKLIDLLVSNGYRVIAPDQRGYSHGARPKSKEDYHIKYLIQDVFSIADYYEFEKFHLVGHDWGSGVGWGATAAQPDRIITWTAMSVPHMDAFAEAYADPKGEQRKKSGYFKFFNMTCIPECLLLRNNAKGLKNIWNESSIEEKKEYSRVLTDKGALTAALNWYRMNIAASGNELRYKDAESLGNIEAPTLFIWGNKDHALGRTGAELTKKYMEGEYTFLERNAGHWLMQEDYEGVSIAILNFFKAHKS